MTAAGGIRGTAAALALAGACLAATACGGEPSGPDDPDAVEPRTFAMGWFLNAPRPDESLIVAAIDSMARVSDVVLLQENPPWPRLLAGETAADLAAEKADLADALRSRGLRVAYLADPLDGLDRTSEAPELVAAGRSVREPEIRALHEEWVREVARQVRPGWFGLASEINTLAQHGDPGLYGELVSIINGLAPEVRDLSGGADVFVSFQVDDAWGLLGPSQVEDPFALVGDFEIDFLGLSTYPVFVFDTPADVPDDYLLRFREATDLPLAMVEGGWNSETTPAAEADVEEQRAFLRRFAEMLDGVDARLWILLTYADLDVDAFGLPPDRAGTLENFAHMGVADVDLAPKPTLATWEEIFARPLE